MYYKHHNYTRWIFVLPAILVVSVLFIYPFLSSIFYSFTNKNLIMPHYSFVGLANYRAVLSDPNFWMSFFNSLKWTIFFFNRSSISGFLSRACVKSS